MSIDLYQYRLFWDGQQGALRNAGQTHLLHEAPQLPGAPPLIVDAIDYAPEVEVAQLREAGADWREMSAAEIAAADMLLAGAADAEPVPLPAAA